GIRIEPGEIEAVLTRHPDIAQCLVLARKDETGHQSLIAYTVPHTAGTAHAPTTEALRALATATLPPYMVPSHFVSLETLPLTANGKVDRQALPAPALTAPDTLHAPRTPSEKIIAGLYAELLALPHVGIEDNFFQLGGDSITAIQLVAGARKRGLTLALQDVFTHQTVAALARTVGIEAHRQTGEVPESEEGIVPLTPVMQALRRLRGPIGGFNQSVLVRVPANLGMERLSSAVGHVVRCHGMLRTRLTESDGDWTLEVLPAELVSVHELVTRVDVSGIAEEEFRAVVREHTRAAQRRLAPHAGVMLQVVWLDGGGDRPGHLLAMAHHLAVDGVSWRVLLPDLEAAWQAGSEGRELAVEPAATSFRRWSQTLSDQAREERRTRELPFWTAMLDKTDPLLTRRRLDPSQDVEATVQRLTLTLPTDITEPLLTKVAAPYNAQINDVLLTAFTLAVGYWRRDRTAAPGRTDILLSVEGHGREEIAEGIDVSRTVGWFTSEYPVRLDPEVRDWEQTWAGGPELGKALKRVKEQLRALPDRGVGYGMLRYLNSDTGAALTAMSAPQISFNYLGRFAVAAERDWTVVAGADGLGGGADPEMPVRHGLSVNAMTEDQAGESRLIAAWSWPDGLWERQDVEALAHGWFRALRALVTHANRPDAGGLTPSDLLVSGVSQTQLDKWEKKMRNAQ
ncbi:condensation domain-containing protein, partial [Streptomyces sp. NPDC086077]|uniref:condensation domain-containing protein n=1 Tax=Streptomyces sp. NPDC086077 TaxID=3154862 RepID=UPI003415138F